VAIVFFSKTCQALVAENVHFFVQRGDALALHNVRLAELGETSIHEHVVIKRPFRVEGQLFQNIETIVRFQATQGDGAGVQESGTTVATLAAHGIHGVQEAVRIHENGRCLSSVLPSKQNRVPLSILSMAFFIAARNAGDTSV